MFEYHQYQNKDLKRYYVKLQEIKDRNLLMEIIYSIIDGGNGNKPICCLSYVPNNMSTEFISKMETFIDKYCNYLNDMEKFEQTTLDI